MTIYDTKFKGKFEFREPVEKDIVKIINGLSNTRRMVRDEDLLEELTGEYFGIEGEFYVPENSDDETAVIDCNNPPSDQPGLWLNWEITEDGKYLQWNGAESFRFYLEWLDYLANNFFVTNNISLNGSVEYQGWDERDCGTIIIEDNQVKLKTDFIYTFGTGVHYEWYEPSLEESFNEMVDNINKLRPELSLVYTDKELTLEEHNILANIYDAILCDEGEMVYDNEELKQEIKNMPNEVVPKIFRAEDGSGLIIQLFEYGEVRHLFFKDETPEEKYWAYLRELSDIVDSHF